MLSDTGAFRLFGVQQQGNADKPLFPYPAPPGTETPDKPVPGLVIPVEESTYWVIAAGQLQKARLAVSNRGQEIVFVGSPVPLGEPVHAGQLNARCDTACAVVRSLNSSGCRAVAFDLRTGEVRWQRQLGFIPAKLSSTDQVAPPLAQGDRFILVDEEGGIIAVPASAGATTGQTVAARASWVLEPAPLGATDPTVVAVSADGRTIYTVTPVDRGGPKFAVRRITDGKLVHKSEVNAPDKLAGQLCVVGNELLIPTANGFVNRFVAGDGLGRASALQAGPAWLGDRRPVGAACSMTPLSNSAFATSDGGKRVRRWEWPAGGQWNPAGLGVDSNDRALWRELRDAVAGPGVVVPPAEPGGAPRFVVAEASGNVWLFASDRGGQLGKPKWQPGAANAVPVGRPTSALAAQTNEAGRTVVAYVVDGKIAVGVDPERDEPLWSARTSEFDPSPLVGVPQPAGANRWVLTDLAGRVVVIDGTTGAVVAAQTVGLQGAVPAAATGVAANSALTPLSDGSAVVIELPKK